jgi:DNA-binding LacI/PurR family transcriptional regulator
MTTFAWNATISSTVNRNPAHVSAIHDLARELGISISTVSRALAGKSNVTDATRQRVLAAAERFGYTPNRSGRSLRSGATHTITFLMTPHPQLLYTEPFFMALLVGVQEALAEVGLDLAVMLGLPGEAQLGQLRQLVESRSSDGVLLAWTRVTDPRIQYLTETGFPFAALGRSRSGGAFPSLDIDFDDLGLRAAARLLARGHRRVALVNTAADLMFHSYLHAGYRRALEAAGVPFDPALTREDPMTEQGGHDLIAALLGLPEPPTALIVCGETTLAGTWRALAERGARPGRDVAVIATTDTPLCTYLQPSITCFHAPLRDLGRRLAQILFAAMPGPQRQVIQEVRKLELVEGASDAAPLRAPPKARRHTRPATRA